MNVRSEQRELFDVPNVVRAENPPMQVNGHVRARISAKPYAASGSRQIR
jgi:hypothetical protein